MRLAELKFTDAEQLFSDAASRDPNFLIARHNLAETYVQMGRPDKAREIDLALLQLHPDDTTAMLALAELAFRAGKDGEAGDWLKKARAAEPKDLGIAVRLVHFYAGQKEWDKAIATAKELLAQDPNNPDLVELVAWARAGGGDADGAASEYQALLKRVPADAALDRRLAYYQRLSGDADGARDTLEAALGIAPDDAGVITDLVQLAYQAGGADAAVETAHTYEQRAPELTDVLAADALVRDNRRDDAIALLQQGQLWHPSVRVAGRLAELTYQAGRRDEAEAMLVALLKTRDDLAPHLALAGMYMADKSYDKAAREYEQALALAPNDPIALNNLAWLYAKGGDKRARELAIQAYRVAPNPQSADTLGWVLEARGEHATALPLLEQAASDLPHDPEVQYHLAATLQASGALGRARTLLERIVGSKAPFSDRDDAERRLKDLSRG